MGAEHFPEVLVSALGEEVQIDLAERRQPAVRVVAEIRAGAVGGLDPVVGRRPVDYRFEDTPVVNPAHLVLRAADHQPHGGGVGA
jgi:hypothetical protein